MSQAHKLHDKVHDIDLSTMDAKSVGEVGSNICIIIALSYHFGYVVGYDTTAECSV